MNYFVQMIGLFLLVAGAIIKAVLLRQFVYHFAFYGMSKTHRTKIYKEQSVRDRLLLFYTAQYNNPQQTKWCIITYYIYCIICIAEISMFGYSIFCNLIPAFKLFVRWLWIVKNIIFILCLSNVLIKPSKK